MVYVEIMMIALPLSISSVSTRLPSNIYFVCIKEELDYGMPWNAVINKNALKFMTRMEFNFDFDSSTFEFGI